MSYKDILATNAVATWKRTHERADKLFDSFDSNDLLQEVAPGRNRLIYLLGHLTAMHDRMLVLLGLGERFEPAFDAIFLTSPDKTNELPSVEKVRETWKRVSGRLNHGIAEFTADAWLAPHSAVSAEDFAKDPLRNRLSILLTRTNHLSYHLRQANLVRR